MDKAFQGRSNRPGNSPYLAGLFFSGMCTVSYLGYKGANSHDSWRHYVKQRKYVGKVFLVFYSGFILTSKLMSVSSNSQYMAKENRLDIKTIKEDMNRMGMVRKGKENK